jgi:hypothetical protein
MDLEMIVSVLLIRFVNGSLAEKVAVLAATSPIANARLDNDQMVWLIFLVTRTSVEEAINRIAVVAERYD